MTLALLHTLWQGILIAALTAAALRLIPASRPTTRYLAALSGLVVIVAAWLVTWSVLNQTTPDTHTSGGRLRLSVSSEITLNNTPTEPDRGRSGSKQTTQTPINWHLITTWAYALGVTLMLLRAAFLLQGAARLRAQCTPLTDPRILDAFASLNPPPRIKLLAGDIPGPCAVGLITPALLLPVSMLTDIAIDEWRMILAHEIAHIRRRDFLVNVIQLIIEALLFFNPAVWWLSRQVRIEREACCDAAAANEPRAYALLLAKIAEAQMPAAALAVKNKHFRGLDRVQRLLLPRHRPALRLPLFTFIILTAITLGALYGLQRTTDVAVKAAAHWLTPQQRVEKIAEVTKDFGPPTIKVQTTDQKISVSGVVLTEDGAPPPKGTDIHLTCDYSGFHESGSASYGFRPNKDTGAFQYTPTEFGTYFIRVTAPGYAMTFTDALRTEPGVNIENVEIVLLKGDTVRIALLAPDGKPVTGADVTTQYAYERSWGKAWCNMPHELSDDGIITIPHYNGMPLRLTADVAGYQYEQRDFEPLQPDATATWALMPADPTRGLIVDAATDAPIPGARVYVVQRKGHAPFTHDPRAARTTPLQPDAVADESGRFVLDRLRDDSSYTLYVAAADHRVALVAGVHAGQTDLRIPLGPPVAVRGRIVGGLDKLHKGPNYSRSKQPYFNYDNTIVFDDSGYSDILHAPVEVRDGIGYFTLDELFLPRVRLNLPGDSRSVNLREPTEELVFDLSGAAPQAHIPTRKVVIRFNPPPGHPQATGMVNVQSYWKEDPNRNLYKDMELADGVVHAETASPGRLHIRPRNMPSYWFEDVNIKQVEPADEPLTVHVPLYPAGAVYGQVLDADGAPAKQFHVNMITRRKAPDAESVRFDVNSSFQAGERGSGKFVYAPIPLGGLYRFYASSGYTVVVGPEMEIDQATPVQEIAMQLPQGVAVTGSVLDPDGKPAVGVMVELGWTSGLGHGVGFADVQTDRFGRFTFDRVNPDVPGTYHVSIKRPVGAVGERQDITVGGEPATIRLQRDAKVRGKVVDAKTGWPIPGADVYAGGDVKPYGWVDADNKTDARGTFVIAHLVPGERYTIGCRDGREQEVTAVAGDDAAVTLRVELSDWSKLKPVAP